MMFVTRWRLKQMLAQSKKTWKYLPDDAKESKAYFCGRVNVLAELLGGDEDG